MSVCRPCGSPVVAMLLFYIKSYQMSPESGQEFSKTHEPRMNWMTSNPPQFTTRRIPAKAVKPAMPSRSFSGFFCLSAQSSALQFHGVSAMLQRRNLGRWFDCVFMAFQSRFRARWGRGVGDSVCPMATICAMRGFIILVVRFIDIFHCAGPQWANRLDMFGAGQIVWLPQAHVTT